jgi:hypothetical protein
VQPGRAGGPVVLRFGDPPRESEVILVVSEADAEVLMLALRAELEARTGAPTGGASS